MQQVTCIFEQLDEESDIEFLRRQLRTYFDGPRVYELSFVEQKSLYHFRNQFEGWYTFMIY